MYKQYEIKLCRLCFGHNKLSHGQMKHVKNKFWQSNIAYRSAFNGEAAKKLKYPEWYKNVTGKILWTGKGNEVFKVEMFEEIWT